MNEDSGAKLLIRLLKASDGTQIFKKSYAVPSNGKNAIFNT